MDSRSQQLWPQHSKRHSLYRRCWSWRFVANQLKLGEAGPICQSFTGGLAATFRRPRSGPRVGGYQVAKMDSITLANGQLSYSSKRITFEDGTTETSLLRTRA